MSNVARYRDLDPTEWRRLWNLHDIADSRDDAGAEERTGSPDETIRRHPRAFEADLTGCLVGPLARGFAHKFGTGCP
jgi:hypothetical protein